ncbi:MAG: DNA cytosine methyltransferase [Planctomycetes bacterium]|nr:DNA cytosine methyltransferase [Planctomycetota bacterium]MCH9779007.1 DNA cytosine methyltransferase [Planctomycetota bacterium]
MAYKKSIVKSNHISHKVAAVDLFCGVGGLTKGLEKSGINVKLGIDIDPACEFPYSENNEAKFLLKSVAKTTGDELRSHFKKNELRLLAGCAPCQTFSTYYQKAKLSDKRWNWSAFKKRYQLL